MKRKTLLLFLCFAVCGHSLFAQVKADDILGYWLTSGKNPAKIQIYKTGNRYSGKIVWLKEPNENGRPKTDKKNPNAANHLLPIVGLQILSNFEFNGEDKWHEGQIYDPESGKTYSCHISFKDGSTLKVRGYIGVSLLGRTEYWKRTTP
jgi:uncharacterized protein (DUF2147 family)